MRLIIFCLVGALVAIAINDCAHAQTLTESNGQLKLWNPSGHLDWSGPVVESIAVSGGLVVGQSYYGQFTFPYSTGNVPGSLEIWDAKGNLIFNASSTGTVQGPSGFSGDTGVLGFSVMIVAPTPTPTPTPVPTPTPAPVQGSNPPVAPAKAPAYVTDCPTLAFQDNFNETNFGTELSDWGPITAPVKWITNKPDGFNFGGFYNSAEDASYAYVTTTGHLVIDMHNYYQAGAPAPSFYLQGDGNWFTGAIASAAYIKQTGGGNTTTGFLAKAPCYWECAVWVPPLTNFDPPNAAGLWPSLSLYTDPQLLPSVGQSMELDLFELYSINYKIPHFSWHIWSAAGAQLSAGGASPTEPVDLSQGWHVYGLWIDIGTITWYLDGVQVFSAPNPGGVGLEPMYFMIANGYGGGWVTSMAPIKTYDLHVAYVICFD